MKTKDDPVTATHPKRAAGGLTICIPHWNHRSFLARSVGSAMQAAHLLASLGEGCQVLVIDDGSRDGSQRVLLSLALADPDGILDVVLVAENGGLAAARNLGLAHARYAYICFMDADNWLFPETVPLFLRAIRETAAAMVYGNLLHVDDEGAIGLLSNTVVTQDLFVRNAIDAFALYDVAAIQRQGGYDEALRSHEDWELTLHGLAEGMAPVFVPQSLGAYYDAQGSMVKTETFDHQRMHRIYDQRRSSMLPARSHGRAYHPDVGWLDTEDAP